MSATSRRGALRRGAARGMASAFDDSTLAELAWHRRRGAAARWGWAGALLGLLSALVAFAPAAWLARAVADRSGQQLLLADAQGTVWNGSARLVLTGGPDSRDASALPGRLQWRLRPAGWGLRLTLSQPCCLVGEPALRLAPGAGRWSAALEADTPGSPATASAAGALQPLGHWPAAWLAGLGTPWNTLQLEGLATLAARDFAVAQVQGRLRFAGAARLDLLGMSSRLSTLKPLGDYRLDVVAVPGGEAAALTLGTLQGALRLSASGQWRGDGLRLRGEAQAAEDTEGALANLLNIIGRRQGARSVIVIG